MSENEMVVDEKLVAELQEGMNQEQPPSSEEPTVLTAEEVISAFEVVYEELIILRNSVINLHERLSKLEPSNGGDQ